MTIRLTLPDEAATARLAEDIAAVVAPGDLIALSGDLGAGKTAFARAFIRALADDPEHEVPSPTFTLVQAYELERLSVTHFDLYRIGAPEELDELGLDEALDGIALVEWPEHGDLPVFPARLDISLAVDGPGRAATLAPGQAWTDRLDRTLAIRDFLGRAGAQDAGRRHLTGDASTRRFERIRDKDVSAVLMDWPPVNVLPVNDRRAPYRARSVDAFIAVDSALRETGLTAPEIFATDTENGFLLMEDFGEAGIAENGQPIRDRYETAITGLATVHGSARPDHLPVHGDKSHRLPRLGQEALMADLAFFADWYLPHVGAAPATEAMAEFSKIWTDLFAIAEAYEQSWVLFDVQSPNLFWLPEREGIARIGWIDVQDMFIGPSAYDIASLCQDMRVTIPADLEQQLFDLYVKLRLANDPVFDAGDFGQSYAILSVARTLKSLGVFARMADHAGRAEYLRHIPRCREYLQRSLAHPVLSRYAQWHKSYVRSTR